MKAVRYGERGSRIRKSRLFNTAKENDAYNRIWLDTPSGKHWLFWVSFSIYTYIIECLLGLIGQSPGSQYKDTSVRNNCLWRTIFFFTSEIFAPSLTSIIKNKTLDRIIVYALCFLYDNTIFVSFAVRSVILLFSEPVSRNLRFVQNMPCRCSLRRSIGAAQRPPRPPSPQGQRKRYRA